MAPARLEAIDVEYAVSAAPVRSVAGLGFCGAGAVRRVNRGRPANGPGVQRSVVVQTQAGPAPDANRQSVEDVSNALRQRLDRMLLDSQPPTSR